MGCGASSQHTAATPGPEPPRQQPPGGGLAAQQDQSQTDTVHRRPGALPPSSEPPPDELLQQQKPPPSGQPGGSPLTDETEQAPLTSAEPPAVTQSANTVPPASGPTSEADLPSDATLQVRHVMWVQGRPTSFCRVLGSFAAAECSELAELMRVWRQQWHCFPAWQRVLDTRDTLLADGVWAGMDAPERRMASELTVLYDMRHTRNEPLSRSTYLGVLERCREARRRGRTSSSSGSCLGPGQQTADPAGDAAPAVPDRRAKLVTDSFLEHFIETHELRQVNCPTPLPAGSSRGSVLQRRWMHPGLLPSLTLACGRVYDMTVQQVVEKIVLPAVQASGGMSYAETFLALPEMPNTRLAVPLEASSTRGLLVAPPPALDFCGLASSLAADSPPGSWRPVWMDMFCSVATGSTPGVGGPASMGVEPGQLTLHTIAISNTQPGPTQPPAPAAAESAASSLVVERRILLEAHIPKQDQPSAAVTTTSPAPADAAAPAAPAAVAPPAGPPGQVRVVVSEILDRQVLRCPADMTQSEADELVHVWQERWACVPSWDTVLRTRAKCGGADPAGGWAAMTYPQRRTACELLVLYGDAAATWRPSAEAEAEARATSSRGSFVSVAFLDRLMEVHGLAEDPSGKDLVTAPGQEAPVWSPRGLLHDATTSWVCANIVLPATKAYGMCYADLFLSAEAQAAFLPPGAPRFCLAAEEAPARAFASHAWACPFRSFHEALTVSYQLEGFPPEKHDSQYWIDIFHKNQWQPVAVHDLKDNLILAGRVAVVVHPFPGPLVITRVWCLFELMTALQVQVEISLFRSWGALLGFSKLMSGGVWTVSYKMTDEVRQQVASLDVATAQATVPADKKMILGMIRESIGVDEMNRQVRELFQRLLGTVETDLERLANEQMSLVPCFAGDGVVQRLELRRAVEEEQDEEQEQEVAEEEAGVCRCEGLAVRRPRAMSSTSRERSPRCCPRCHRDDTAVHSVRTRPCLVADLRPGNMVVTADGGVSSVVLLTAEPVGPDGMEVCALPPAHQGGSAAGGVGAGGPPLPLLVTPDHPVRVGGVWRLPRHLQAVERLSAQQVPYGAIFNLELDPPAPLEVSGVVLVTLGQDTSREAREGVDPASDALYGWGWRDNPDRLRGLRAQAARVAREAAAEAAGLGAGRDGRRGYAGVRVEVVAGRVVWEAVPAGVGGVRAGGDGGRLGGARHTQRWA